MAKKHVRVKKRVAMCSQSTLGQLPCKRKSCHLLTCTLRRLPCSLQKHMATRVKESCHLLTSKARAVAMYPAETHDNCQLRMWVRRRACGRSDKRPHTSPLCVRENWCVDELLNAHTPAPVWWKRTCGRPDKCPHTSLVLRGT